jgi:hypothetical protein
MQHNFSKRNYENQFRNFDSLLYLYFPFGIIGYYQKIAHSFQTEHAGCEVTQGLYLVLCLRSFQTFTG